MNITTVDVYATSLRQQHYCLIDIIYKIAPSIHKEVTVFIDSYMLYGLR
jgi:hypothetical protein